MTKARLYDPIISLPYSLHRVPLSLVIIKINPIVIIVMIVMVDIVDVVVQQVQHL